MTVLAVPHSLRTNGAAAAAAAARAAQAESTETTSEPESDEEKNDEPPRQRRRSSTTTTAVRAARIEATRDTTSDAIRADDSDTAASLGRGKREKRPSDKVKLIRSQRC